MISATSSAGALSSPPPWTEPPTSLTTTVAPWPANSRASPRPLRWPAPVTIATFPSRIPIVWADLLVVSVGRRSLVGGDLAQSVELAGVLAAHPGPLVVGDTT